MIINEKELDKKDFQKGIQIILEAFNEQKKQYIKIINTMNEKIISLEQQINNLKEENTLYQNKLLILQKNIKCISKSICQLKDDEILNNVTQDNNNNNNNNKINEKDKSNLFENEKYLKPTINKNQFNDLFKTHNLNMNDKQKMNNKNHKNMYYNEINYYTKDGEVSSNKKDKIYKKAINKILNNKNMMNKNESNNINKKANNENINYLENKEKVQMNFEYNNKNE